MSFIKDIYLAVGNPIEYILSEWGNGLWHIFMDSVNMSYIDCDVYRRHPEQLPTQRNNTFYLITYIDEV